MKETKRNNANAGQAVLLVVLVMAVIGSVTLSVASRSVSGLRVQEVANESIKAFKAAEAGLERALLSKQNVMIETSDKVSYSATFDLAGTNGIVTEDRILEGEVVEIDTTGAVSQVNILWSSPAAIKVTEYYQEGGESKIKNDYYDSDESRVSRNKFEFIAGDGIRFEGVDFDRGVGVTLSSGSRKLRVLVLYSDSQIGFQGTLPEQKKVVTSRGEYVEDDKRIVREIQYSESEDRLPVVFDHVLYTANGSLTQ